MRHANGLTSQDDTGRIMLEQLGTYGVIPGFGQPPGPVQPSQVPERNPLRNYAVSWLRNSPSLAVALNFGMGSSFLNALVNAFAKLHMVRAENSGYSGSKNKRCTSARRLRGASNSPSTNASYRISFARSSVICEPRHCSTCRCIGSEFLWIRSTPTASVSIRLKLLLCLAKTGVNTHGTMLPEFAPNDSELPREPIRDCPKSAECDVVGLISL
jgi:hypothetical protein